MNFSEDLNEVLKDCVEKFEKLNIEYMLTGSMAMLHYAVGRMTRDIDIVIKVSDENAVGIIKEFESDYYVSKDRVWEAISNRFMFNMIHQQTVVKVDCVVQKKTGLQQSAFERRKKMKFGDFEVWTISKEDLILAKLDWARDTKSEMQMKDVCNMLRENYDKNYLNDWTKKLKVEELLEECLKKLE